MIGETESIITIYFGRENGGETSPRGSIRVEPHIWLIAKGTLGNFRKMLKLSAESDRTHGTATLSLWEEAAKDLYRESKDEEARLLIGAEHEYKARLRASVEWRDTHLRKEEERFRKQKVHRGKSHVERVREIEEKYRRMLVGGKKRYTAETERIQKRAVRKCELAAAQLQEIRKLREGDVASCLSSLSE